MGEMDLNWWQENIFSAIKDISDIEMQKLSWSGTHTEFVSSFTEVLARLYDDLDFDEYISFYLSKYGNTELFRLLNKFNLQVNSFKDYGYELEHKVDGYLEILNDQRWVEISKTAGSILSLISNL